MFFYGAPRGPQIWGRFAALLGMLSQCCFGPTEVRLHFYVDDPIAILKGAQEHRKHCIAVLVMIWMALGTKLAFPKGERGQKVVWIGFTLCTNGSTNLQVSIKDQFLKDLRKDTDDIMVLNIVPVKTLRVFAGKCNHVAGLIPCWRPFLSELWAAISTAVDTPGTTAPPQTVFWASKSCARLFGSRRSWLARRAP